MPDMLVKLYELKDNTQIYKDLEAKGVKIIRPMTPNKYKVHDFILKHFGEGWANETDTAFTRFPVSCFVAVDSEKAAGRSGATEDFGAVPPAAKRGVDVDAARTYVQAPARQT